MKKYLSKKQVIIILMIFALIVVVDKITKPLPLSYDQAIEKVVETSDGIDIIFKDVVSNYVINDDKTNPEKVEVNIIGYQTLISKILDLTHSKAVTVDVKETVERIYYEEAFVTGEDQLLYGVPVTGVRVTLPRLALSYYFLLAIVCFMISIALRGLIENKVGKQIIQGLVAVSGSYILTNFLIKGFSATTYFIIRDIIYLGSGTLILMIPILYFLDNERH